ncbi:MAG: hypothetical protein FD123_3566 [Bacteroidetes bacterium]|nr:MAG: hypothetical protein FD123_3566 [Bacteroidota bacterium]
MNNLSIPEILILSLVGIGALALVIVLYRREMKKPKRRNGNSWHDNQQEITQWHNSNDNSGGSDN